MTRPRPLALTLILILFLLTPAMTPRAGARARQQTWAAGLTLAAAGEFVHAGTAYRSSSSVVARWTARTRASRTTHCCSPRRDPRAS